MQIRKKHPCIRSQNNAVSFFDAIYSLNSREVDSKHRLGTVFCRDLYKRDVSDKDFFFNRRTLN